MELSENRIIANIWAMNHRVVNRWNRLTPDQRRILVSISRTADKLSEEFVIKNIAKIRRQKCA